MTAPVTVEPVTGRRGHSTFVELPYRLYRDDRRWVPPLRAERRRFLNPRHNPYFEHAEVALWLARRGRRVVGRLSSQVDHLYESHHGHRLAAFGFFESERDPEVAVALLDHAAAWGRERGATRLRGPLSFSTNHESGLLVEGFDEPPVIGMPYNPPWYEDLLEGWGLTKEMDLLTATVQADGVIDSAEDLPAELLRLAGGVAALTGAVVRRARRDDLTAEIGRVVHVYNQAWARNWGFVPLTPSEARALARDLGAVLDLELALLAEVGGEPVGVLLGVRDLNQVLIRLGGRLLPFGWLTALRARRRVDVCRLILFGVLEAYRGLGIDALLVVEAVRAGLAAGYRRVEMGWILESNQALLRPLKTVGGRLGMRVQRRHRVFHRPI